MSEPGMSNMRSDEPEPFAGQAERTSGGGCGKPAWIGCGALLILLGILAIVFVVKSKDLFRWSIQRVESNIMDKLPEGTTPAEKARLTAAFDGAIKAVTEGKANPADIEDLQAALVHAAQSSKSGLTHQDLEELTTALEKVAGIAPPAKSAPKPDEMETPTPTAPQGTAPKPNTPPQGNAQGSVAA